MKTFLNLRNIFVAMFLSLSVCLNSSSTIAKTTTTTAVAITADTPNNCTNCPKKQQPHSFKHKMKTKVVPTMVDPQEAYEEFMKKKNKQRDISQYLGEYDSKFSCTLDGSGQGIWETLPNGDRVWRINLCSSSNLITAIGVLLSSDLYIPEGCQLFVYSNDKKQVTQPITQPNYKGKKQLLVNSIPSKNIWIEYYEPKHQQGRGKLPIVALLYRFVDFPYSIYHKTKDTVTFINPFNSQEEEQCIKYDKNPIVGKPMVLSSGYVGINILSKGSWKTLPNGDRICRLGFETSMAYTLTFSMFMDIPEGAYVAFSAADGLFCSSLHHEATNRNEKMLHTYPMPGNKYIVEYYEPRQHKGKGQLKLWSMEADVTTWVANSSRSSQPDAVACSPNVVCDCDEFNFHNNTDTDTFCSDTLWNKVAQLKHSIIKMKMLFPCINPNSIGCKVSVVDTTVKVYDPLGDYFFCSGALVNNSQHIPYALSAYHCINSPEGWNTLTTSANVGDKLYFIFSYNFEELTCNDSIYPSNLGEDISIKGSIVVSGNAKGDFALFQLNEAPPIEYQPYYAGWDALTQTLPTQGLSISHPYGYDKRYAIQDDNISLMPTDVNDGVKPFYKIAPNTTAQQLKDIVVNDNGEMFGLTFDRGATTPGSSGSPFFNQNSRIVGTLSGGSVACEVQSNITKPNGNNDFIETYGRLWYYYEKYDATPNSNFDVPIDVSADGTIDTDERKKTLKYWLQDFDNDSSNDGMMDGLEVTDCEIYLKDNPWDNSHNEPNQTALIDNSWYDIWESPDLWNTTVAFNTDIDPENYEALLGSDNEEPDFIDNTSNELLDNYIRYNVRTPYTNECTTQPASLHLYWTIASTGEMWPDHWINHYVDNDCLVGQEITIHSNGDPYPIAIDPLAENRTWEGYVHWSPPNFTDPTVDDYYPYYSIDENGPCSSINADADNNDKVEICLLARLQSLDNPIFGIETANTAQNVLNSNNIVTRNTFLADPGIVGMAPDGGPSGNIISYGHPSIILIANNNDYVKNLDITLDKISEGSTEALEQLMYIDLIPGDELWQKWESTGFKGEGIQIIAEKVIRVTNLETAKLLDIPFDAKEFEPLKIKVTIISYTGKRPSVADLPNEYKFRVSHRASRPAEQGSINPPTDCLFTVKDIAKYGSTALPTEISLKVYPNPFKDQLNIVFTLPTDSPVSLNLYDIQGRLIKNINSNTALPAGLNTYQIDTNDLPKGMYICHLIANKTAVAKKVVK
jgi:hypothetical protein